MKETWTPDERLFKFQSGRWKYIITGEQGSSTHRKLGAALTAAYKRMNQGEHHMTLDIVGVHTGGHFLSDYPITFDTRESGLMVMIAEGRLPNKEITE